MIPHKVLKEDDACEQCQETQTFPCSCSTAETGQLDPSPVIQMATPVCSLVYQPVSLNMTEQDETNILFNKDALNVVGVTYVKYYEHNLKDLDQDWNLLMKTLDLAETHLSGFTLIDLKPGPGSTSLSSPRTGELMITKSSK